MAPSITTTLTEPEAARRFLLPYLRRHYPGTTAIPQLDIEPLGSVQAGRGVFRFNAITGGTQRRRLELFANHDARGGAAGIYHMLRHLERHGFGQGRLRAPQPLGYSHLHRTLVYESFPGTRVRDLLERGTLRAGALQQLLKQSADWLRRFHQLPTTIGKRRTSTIALRPNHRLQPGRQRLLQGAVPVINRTLRRTRHRVALVHGDPHLANCIRGTAGTFAFIDYSESYLGNTLADIGMFLVHLDVALQPYYARTTVRQLQTNFIRHYFRGRSLDPQLCEAIVAFQLRSAVQFLEFTTDHHRKPRGYVGWMLQRFEQIIVTGLREINSSKPSIVYAS